MQTIFWHDYETFGANPQKDRPSQFAGIRTDLDLNIVDESITLYCRPAEDFLPSPDACLITGITPQKALSEGVVEVEFCRRIHGIFSKSDTCVAGYNSIRFDDEVTRNLFYRNFYDPYEREWKNGNSRWDLIDVVRLTYALKPEGIIWPVGADGQVSFRLEMLTKANGIEHLAAHDAMSDVYATIELARLVKRVHPKLYDYAFKLRDKNNVLSCLDVSSHKPVLHVSSKFPAALGCCALVAPLFQHPKNKNAYIAFDLRQDPRQLSDLGVDEIHRRLYTPAVELTGSEARPALKALHVNKCAMVAPASMLRTISAERLATWQLDEAQMRLHLGYLRENPDLIERLKLVFDQDYQADETADPDLMIYSGGFFSASDKKEMAKVRGAKSFELSELEFIFQDKRLPEMLLRYKARNFPETLTEEERESWESFRAMRLMTPESNFLNVERFMARIIALSEGENLSSQGREILIELQYYAESVLPYS